MYVCQFALPRTFVCLPHNTEGIDLLEIYDRFQPQKLNHRPIKHKLTQAIILFTVNLLWRVFMFVCVCLSLSVLMSVCLPVFVCLSMSSLLSFCLCQSLFVLVSVCLPVFVYVLYLSVCLHLAVPVLMYVWVSISFLRVSVCLHVCLFDSSLPLSPSPCHSLSLPLFLCFSLSFYLRVLCSVLPLAPV